MPETLPQDRKSHPLNFQAAETHVPDLNDAAAKSRVPHLRDGLIVAKVGLRATREPLSSPPARPRPTAPSQHLTSARLSALIHRLLPIAAALIFLASTTNSHAQSGLPQMPPVGGASSLSGGTPTLRSRSQPSGNSSVSSVPDDFSSITLAPGYLLEMQVYDMPEISGELRVDSDGNVNVPMAGPVHVNGDTVTQAREAIESKLRDAQILKNPKINLDISQYSAANVTVLGEVEAPGRVQMLGPHSLSDVLAMAGGETITAGATVEIRRTVDGRIDTQTVDYARSKGTPAALDIVVRPGDTVTVPRAGIVYVLGAVNRPGGYVMQEDGQLNVAQALALAYGTQLNAAIGSIRIVHKNPDGTLTETPVAFRKITRGKAVPQMLHAEDIVYVPVSKGKTILSASLGMITATSSALIYTHP